MVYAGTYRWPRRAGHIIRWGPVAVKLTWRSSDSVRVTVGTAGGETPAATGVSPAVISAERVGMRPSGERTVTRGLLLML